MKHNLFTQVERGSSKVDESMESSKGNAKKDGNAK